MLQEEYKCLEWNCIVLMLKWYLVLLPNSDLFVWKDNIRLFRQSFSAHGNCFRIKLSTSSFYYILVVLLSASSSALKDDSNWDYEYFDHNVIHNSHTGSKLLVLLTCVLIVLISKSLLYHFHLIVDGFAAWYL